MPRSIKILLILFLFIGFFEAGLLSSYTIITSEPPDVRGIVDLQINTIAELFSSENIGEVLIKDPEQVNITNKGDITKNLSTMAKVDGIDLNNFNVTTYSASQSGEIEVEINALGFSSPNTKSGQIVLSGTPDYRIIAKAMANSTSGGIKVDPNSIQVMSILKLYNGSNTSNNNN